jgi:hypothetical protein
VEFGVDALNVLKVIATTNRFGNKQDGRYGDGGGDSGDGGGGDGGGDGGGGDSGDDGGGGDGDDGGGTLRTMGLPRMRL